MENKNQFIFQDGFELDIDCPQPSSPIIKLPEGFKIDSPESIETLKEHLSYNTTATNLYRGLERKDYKLNSTISRKMSGVEPSKIAEVEKTGLELFDQEVLQPNWLKHKCSNISDYFFKVSIARHLGLYCRLIDVTACLETAIWFAVMNPKFYNEDGQVAVIIIDKLMMNNPIHTPIGDKGLHYLHAPFVADDFNDLPLGEQRRFRQDGHFLWVDEPMLNNEQDIIEKSAKVLEFIIPSTAKISLAKSLFDDYYSGFAYRSQIDCINKKILNNNH